MSEKEIGDLDEHVHREIKKWSEIKGENSWTMFKVIAELVDGFEILNKLDPCISIFGSARAKPDDKYYQLATDIAIKCTEEGFGVITGGGPGIMEAANKGAYLQGGLSVGLFIRLSTFIGVSSLCSSGACAAWRISSSNTARGDGAALETMSHCVASGSGM